MIKVLFVCLGNICRSPTAEGVFTHLVQAHGLEHLIEIDSAGTGDWHLGKAPDQRAQAAAKKRGYDLSALRARQVQLADFDYYELILAMDANNQHNLCQLAAPNQHHKIRLFLEFGRLFNVKEVPDPYYGGVGGFEHVLDLIEDAAAGLLEHVQKNFL